MAVHALETGGTGFVGSNAVAALNERGVGVRVLHGPTSSLAALEGLSCEPCVGDPLGAADALAAAMDGCTRAELGVPATPFRDAVEQARDRYVQRRLLPRVGAR